MYGDFKKHLQLQLKTIRDDGLYKEERVITSPQGSDISVRGANNVLNMCANNYLGLAQNPLIKAAAEKGLEDWGYGMASVRFICGTQTIHKTLEEQLTRFLGTRSSLKSGNSGRSLARISSSTSSSPSWVLPATSHCPGGRPASARSACRACYDACFKGGRR